MHAEINAILNYAMLPRGPIEGGLKLMALTSYSPCHQCFLSLAYLGVKTIFFKEIYKRECENFTLARELGVIMQCVSEGPEGRLKFEPL